MCEIKVLVFSNILFFVACFNGVLQAQIKPLQVLVQDTRYKIGTQTQIIVYTSDMDTGREAIDSCYALLDDINLIISDYDPASDLTKLNETAIKEDVEIHATLYDLLTKSIALSTETDGLFDCTIGPLTQQWRHASSRNKIPNKSAIKRAKKKVGYQHLQLVDSSKTLTCNRSGMIFDFGGIGKGYLLDTLSGWLRAHDILAYLINLGGDIAVGQAPPNQPGWMVELLPWRSPFPLSNVFVACSGSTYQVIESKDQISSHIIRIASGEGLAFKNVVVVLSPADGYRVDALASAITIESDHKNEFTYPNIAYIIAKEDKTLFSKNFNKYIRSDL